MCTAETEPRKYIISDMHGEMLGENRSIGSFRFALSAIEVSINDNAPNKAVKVQSPADGTLTLTADVRSAT